MCTGLSPWLIPMTVPSIVCFATGLPVSTDAGMVAISRFEVHHHGRSVAQPGSASVWGAGGRGFKSRRSDQEIPREINKIWRCRARLKRPMRTGNPQSLPERLGTESGYNDRLLMKRHQQLGPDLI